MTMKNKRKILAIVCMTVMGFTTACGGGNTVCPSDEYGTLKTNVKPDTWQEVSGDSVKLENHNISLQMDTTSTHFVITDYQNNTIYNSSVAAVLDDAQMDLNEKVQSELLINYYDENGQKQEMNSWQHSVTFGNYKVLKNENSIRVDYTMQLKETPPFVPEVLNEDIYKEIAGQLDSKSMFKLKLMYKFYDINNETTDAKEVRSKYSYAKDHSIYVLKSSLSDSDRTALSQYIAQAGYTQEQYQKELKLMKITLQEEQQLQFVVPVVYTLTEKGFDIQVLSDEIQSANDKYQIQSVALLPYFNTGIVTDKVGFMLLPDGSGSIMKIDKADNAGYVQKLYGNDLTCENQIIATNTKNASMAILGYSSSQGSFAAYVSGAAEMAKINAYRAGNTEYCAHGYAEFELYGTDDFTMRMSTTPMAMFSKNISSERPEVKFTLLKKNADIMDMVNWYKEILLSQEKIIQNLENSQQNLYLEFTGYITQEASFMGISYEEKVVLSTIKDVTDAVKSLYEKGIENIHVRLTGYGTEGGKYHGMIEKFTLYKGVGTIKELVDLRKLLQEHGGDLYLEHDLFSVYQDSLMDGFSSTSHSVRRLDKTLADVSDSDLVTGETENGIHTRYLISPKLYESSAKSFKETISDEFNVSIADAGNLLVSDFNTNNEFDRIQTRKAVQNALDILKGNNTLMTDVGNEYVLPYADHIVNMALSDSNYDAESYSIPFFQLVLYGEISFAGEAVNITKNPEKVKFSTLLSGASLYYTCVTDKTALESLESDQRIYPTSFEVVEDEIVTFYQEHKELEILRSKTTVTDFQMNGTGVYKVTYDDSIVVVFNENNEAVEWSNQIIEAHNYYIVRK